MRLSELRFSDLIRLKRHLSLQYPTLWGEDKMSRRGKGGEKMARRSTLLLIAHVGRLYA